MPNAIPETLRKAFVEKKLIPIVGAGVSMSLRNTSGEILFPSWPELLQRAASKLTKENKSDYADAITGSLGVRDYQKAADYARQGLTGSLWNQFFKETFFINRDVIHEESLLLPRAIWTLSERIITLNYDRVMRFACPTPDELLELDNTAKGELNDFKSPNNKPTVWHLHGRIDNLETIILTSESYNQLYLAENPDYQAALTTFTTLCSTTTLVFIGCSLSDAELLQQLGSQHEIFAGNTMHYALVHEADKTLIETTLKDLPINLISFADFGQPLLETIAAISTSTLKPSTQPTPTLVPTIATSPAINPSKRIAILTANPIGENYDYSGLLTEFSTLKCEISYHPLTIKALNELNDVDYIFILSVLIKNNIVIEDEALQSERCSFKNLEDNIGNGSTQGLFIFLNHPTKSVLETPELACDIATLQLPTLIFPCLNKSQLSSFHFQYFRKNNLQFIADSTLLNANKFILNELKDKKIQHRNNTPLASAIDPKNTVHYLGRKTDLQTICQKIVALQGVNEVLTIKGSGGIGKTATVKKIAVALSQRQLFAEGIDFIDCEFISDYSTFEKKLAASFNLENALDIPQQMKATLAKQDKLIILDNVETLLHLPDTTKIKDFIYFICDYASILITSRELLGLTCETVHELSRLSSDDAYALFIKHLKHQPTDTTEQQFIRQEIVERLLDNNPLAIELVAKNLPSSKKMQDLKQDLEQDFFRKASIDELAYMDALTDSNIENKRSLYASINFSYKHLNEDEKKAFELLSLFPDGIDIGALKRIADNRKAKQRQSVAKNQPDKAPILPMQGPVISDKTIKSLEDKSIIQIDNQTIKLQSIMGKFAEQQLQKRSQQELKNYYQRASVYHIELAEDLNNLFSLGDRTDAACRFNQQQANFFKCIGYVHVVNIPIEVVLNYLNNLVKFAIRTTSTAIFAEVLTQAEGIKNLLHTHTDALRCFELILLQADYFAGNFASAFNALQQQMPLKTLQLLTPKTRIEGIIGRIASDIYEMEGEILFALEYDIRLKLLPIFEYPPTLVQVGVFNTVLVASYQTAFNTLEAKYALNMLGSNEVDKCIASTYEKDHLSLMQLHYLKAKWNQVNKQFINSQQIQSLVIVNPFTRGLQQLMLAFASNTPVEAIDFYQQALGNLKHIKYYYVEALLHYARYLQQQALQTQFADIYQQGYTLACRHHYRWLRYQFEDLHTQKTTTYNPADYPLPEVLDIEGYIQALIKHNNR